MKTYLKAKMLEEKEQQFLGDGDESPLIKKNKREAMLEESAKHITG